jgi:DNA-binding transcriptional regulator YdaS (Cro superfamily)
LFSVDREMYRRITVAARHTGRLMAIHAALVGDEGRGARAERVPHVRRAVDGQARGVAVAPVDWDPATTDAVVLGRTAGGDVIAPLVPREP